jgi:sugar phosphate isomerase/epimerase
MYKAFSSELLWFPGRSLKDDIPLAAKYGYEGINFDIKKELAAFSPEELSELLSENKLKPGSFALPVEFRKDKETFEADLKTLRPCCEFAQKIGFTRCTTYIMSYSDTLDYKSNFKLHEERLTATAKILEDCGIRLGLEFLGPPSLRKGKAYEFIHDLDGLTELLDAIKTTNTGYLLDVL